MKKLFVGLVGLILVLFAVDVYAATGLAWSTPTTGGAVANYTLYYAEGTTVGTTFKKTVPATILGIDFTALNVAAGRTYTFIVRCSNEAGESPDSNSVTYTLPSFTPPVDVLPPVPATAPGTAVLQLK